MSLGLGVAPQAIRGGCTPGNSRLGAVSCTHACTNRWRTCAAGVISQANMPHGSAGQFAPLGPGPQWGPSRTDRAGRRDARFARAHRAVSARPRPSAWALNSRLWQLAVALLFKRLAHVRGGLHPRQFAARGRAGQFAPLGPGPQWGPSRTDRAGRRDARFARAHQ